MLTDEKPAKRAPGLSVLVPLLDHKQACNAREVIDAIRNQDDALSVGFVSVSSLLVPQLSEYAFVLKMADDSMIPEMRVGDVLVVEPLVEPEPGDYVVVKISGKSEVIVCLYRKLSYTSSEFELLTLNENWPNISVNESVQVGIIGTVVQNIRGYY